METLGAGPRIENLLQKNDFGPFPRPFSLNVPNTRLKWPEKMTQNRFPSLRLLFSDRLLEALVQHSVSPLVIQSPITGASR